MQPQNFFSKTLEKQKVGEMIFDVTSQFNKNILWKRRKRWTMCQGFASKRHKGCSLWGSRTARQGLPPLRGGTGRLGRGRFAAGCSAPFGCLDLRVPCPKGALANAAGYCACTLHSILFEIQQQTKLCNLRICFQKLWKMKKLET